MGKEKECKGKEGKEDRSKGTVFLNNTQKLDDNVIHNESIKMSRKLLSYNYVK